MVLSSELKRRIRSGQVTLGTWQTMAHWSISEILAQAGYEWVVIDMEHTSIDVSEALQLTIAIDGAGSVPLVRVAANDAAQIKAVMDAGAAGVLVPAVNARADAELAVRSVKYPPAGARGVGIARAHRYGPGFTQYVERNNDESIVVLQVEHAAGVRAIDEIVSVPGVDAVLIGPYDLSASLGLPGQLDHPDVVAAQRTVVRACLSARVAPGIHLVHPERAASDLEVAIGVGFRFIALGTDALFLGEGARAVGRAARSAPAERPAASP